MFNQRNAYSTQRIVYFIEENLFLSLQQDQKQRRDENKLYLPQKNQRHKLQ